MKNKYLLYFTATTLIFNSCSSNKINFSSISEIEATTINSRTKNSFFNPKETYTPLYVRVNYIYLLDENGKGNFNGKNEDDNEIINTIYKKINYLYANLKNPKDSTCYTGNDFIKDTKIQFKFNSLYVKDTFARNYRNSPKYNEKRRSYAAFSPSSNWYLSYLDKNINDTISKKGINVYLNMDKVAYDDVVLRNSSEGYDKTVSNSVSQFPSYTDFNRSSQVCIPNKYTKRLWMENIYCPKKNRSWEKKVKHWFIGTHKGMSHEIGHSLSLAHSNEYHKTNKCFKAMMNQSGKSPRNYIQPSEIGKMHKALMISNLIQFTEENANYNTPLIIKENQNWDFKTIRFYQDIIVEEGQILILNGTVILPSNASILLEKNAVLVLNKATLNTANNKPFTNIIKEKHAKIVKY